MECAVWYWSHFSLYVEMYDDEAEAAGFAVSLEDHSEGSVAGVQMSDGSFTSRDDWAEYAAEENRRRQQYREWEAEAAAKPQPAMRRVVPPFEAKGQTVELPAEEVPSWLGRQVAPR